MSLQIHHQYCSERVRTYDYDRFFAATFAPPAVRRGLLALYAFNIEIASVRERVSERLLGEIRLQWWREVLDEIYAGSVREHAVAAELAHAIENFDIPKTSLSQMIDSRLFDLQDEAPEDIQAFENYAAETAGVVVATAYRICGTLEAVGQGVALGTVWGGTGLLRTLPFHLSQGRVYLPKDLLRRVGTTPSLVRDNLPEINLAPAVRDLCRHLHSCLDNVQPETIPKQARPAASYVALARTFLGRLEKQESNPFAPSLTGGRSAAQFRIIRSVLSGKV